MAFTRGRGGGVSTGLDGLSTFSHPNVQFLVLGGSERLPGWFVRFLAHFCNVKKQMKQIGSKQSALWCCFGSGGWERGLKLFGQCPNGNTHFKKGLPYILKLWTINKHIIFVILSLHLKVRKFATKVVSR